MHRAADAARACVCPPRLRAPPCMHAAGAVAGLLCHQLCMARGCRPPAAPPGARQRHAGVRYQPCPPSFASMGKPSLVSAIPGCAHAHGMSTHARPRHAAASRRLLLPGTWSHSVFSLGARAPTVTLRPALALLPPWGPLPHAALAARPGPRATGAPLGRTSCLLASPFGCCTAIWCPSASLLPWSSSSSIRRGIVVTIVMAMIAVAAAAAVAPWLSTPHP
jgi:hypothetical protein